MGSDAIDCYNVFDLSTETIVDVGIEISMRNDFVVLLLPQSGNSVCRQGRRSGKVKWWLASEGNGLLILLKQDTEA